MRIGAGRILSDVIPEGRRLVEDGGPRVEERLRLVRERHPRRLILIVNQALRAGRSISDQVVEQNGSVQAAASRAASGDFQFTWLKRLMSSALSCTSHSPTRHVRKDWKSSGSSVSLSRSLNRGVSPNFSICSTNWLVRNPSSVLNWFTKRAMAPPRMRTAPAVVISRGEAEVSVFATGCPCPSVDRSASDSCSGSLSTARGSPTLTAPNRRTARHTAPSSTSPTTPGAARVTRRDLIGSGILLIN